MSAAAETGRIEAFSDGVFAIAITLLILEIHVPRVGPGASLGAALLHAWPSYLAYALSFVTIGVMWMNHHRLFGLIRRGDDVLLALNLLLLLGVSFVPFPTAVLAEHLRGAGARTAALVYSGTFLVISFLFQGLWRYASGRRRLIGDGVAGVALRRIDRQYILGPIFYGIATVLAPFSASASVGVALALAVVFALPPSLFAPRA
ncbi:MAG TPA: TMEM175 family protein [Anaeromyxobacter sp.]